MLSIGRLGRDGCTAHVVGVVAAALVGAGAGGGAAGGSRSELARRVRGARALPASAAVHAGPSAR